MGFPEESGDRIFKDFNMMSWYFFSTSHVLNSDITINSLPTLDISLGIVALFEKIYDEQPILTPSSQISGRMYNVQYRCFSYVYGVKSVSQLHTMP